MIGTILTSIGLFVLGLALPAEAAVNFSIGSLLGALLTIIVIAIICWLLWWLIGYAGLPEPRVGVPFRHGCAAQPLGHEFVVADQQVESERGSRRSLGVVSGV